jgi:sugar phosphate isomerase/epimerase
MKLGFLTSCLSGLTLEQVAVFASKTGFQTLELPAGPVRNDRVSQLDVATLDAGKAAAINELLGRHGLAISSLAYYDNMMSPNAEERRAMREHLRKVIDAAKLLGVELVGTFIGNDPGAPPAQVLEQAGTYFGEVCEYAAERDVRLMIENCPMEGWQQPFVPGNLAYAPAQWDELFSRAPLLGLNYDPSHLYWLGIDHLQALRDYHARVFHTHAKDCELLLPGRQRSGILGRGWWRFRVPGYGAIDWHAFISALWDIGFDGALSIEHEDDLWEGSEELVKGGLALGQRHLAAVLP